MLVASGTTTEWSGAKNGSLECSLCKDVLAVVKFLIIAEEVSRL